MTVGGEESSSLGPFFPLFTNVVERQRPRELWELPSGKGGRGCVLVLTVPAKFFIQK